MLIGERVGMYPDPRKIAAGKAVPERLFGVEVELENCKKHPGPPAKYWEYKEDHSLRSHTGHSMELVFSVPLGGADAEAAIHELVGILQYLSPENSERCGTHIHVDVRDLTVEHYNKFLAAAYLVEPILLYLYAPGRDNNAFCLPQYKGVEPSKYRGVNRTATEVYGSVEFRMFSGTDDAIKLIGLMCTLGRLCEKSATLSPEAASTETAAALLGISVADIPKEALLYMPSAICASVLLMGDTLGNEPAIRRKVPMPPNPIFDVVQGGA